MISSYVGGRNLTRFDNQLDVGDRTGRKITAFFFLGFKLLTKLKLQVMAYAKKNKNESIKICRKDSDTKYSAGK